MMNTSKRYLRIDSDYLNCVHDLDENDNVVIVHKKDDETIIEHLTIDQAINNFYNLPTVKSFGITKAYIWNFTDQKIDKVFTNLPDTLSKNMKKEYEIKNIQLQIQKLTEKLNILNK